MGVYTHSDGNWLSRRGAFLVALILFHLVLFWALKSGFAVKFIESITEPIKVDIVNEVDEEEPPPPPPPPKMEIPPVQIPPPVVDITIAPDVQTTALTNVTDKPPPPAPPAPPVVRQTVHAAEAEPEVLAAQCRRLLSRDLATARGRRSDQGQGLRGHQWSREDRRGG